MLDCRVVHWSFTGRNPPEVLSGVHINSDYARERRLQQGQPHRTSYTSPRTCVLVSCEFFLLKPNSKWNLERVHVKDVRVWIMGRPCPTRPAQHAGNLQCSAFGQ